VKRRVDSVLLERASALERLIQETPIVPLEFPGMRLYAKLEYQNPFGSLKDRAAFWILKAAIQRGQVVTGSTIIESSSGNFALALAYLSRLLGLTFIPVIDPNITESYESQLRRLCDTVVKVDTRDDTGGFLKTRLNKVQQLLSELPESFWTNQYGNPDNTAAHYHLTGAEICRALPTLDCVFIGVSSGGTISGLSKRIKEHNPATRIIAVDAEGSIIFGGPPKKRYIPGIGSSIVPALVQEAIIDEVIMIPEHESATACKELLYRHGLFVGGSTGTVYAAILRHQEKLRQAQPPNVLFLCADRGTAYLDTVFNPSWTAKLGA